MPDKCPECSADLQTHDHKLSCSIGSTQEQIYFEIPIEKIFSHAVELAEKAEIDKLVDDADSNAAMAYEVASAIALAAIVSVHAISKQEALRAFSAFYDQVQKISKQKLPASH